ncbi:MAG: ribosome recycling factor [Phycisphaerales bacterium]
MTPESIVKDASTQMTKAVDYLRSELKGIRTGRASTAIVEYIKVEYYGSMTDLKSLAAISVPEATQLVIQPFDPQSVGEIKKAIENANLGLNPMVDGKIIRVNVPPLSGDRRKQLIAQVKKMGEESKVACRNIRRDANKHVDVLSKDKAAAIPEDAIKALKEEIQELLKKHETEIEEAVTTKSEDISHI